MKKYFLILVSVIVLISISGCTPRGTPAARAGVARDSVTISVEAPWSTMDPHLTTTFVNMYPINQLYEALTHVLDDGTVIPWLADSWTISPDGRVYTFQLKQGVRFHNGEPFTASDVAFSYERARTTPHMRDNTAAISNINVISDHVLEVTLGVPFAPFLSYMANVYIINEKFFNENDENLGRVACGTGPYTLDSIEMNTVAVMRAFPDYHRGEARIKNLTFRVFLDYATANMALRAGEIDFYSPTAAQLVELRADPNFHTASLPTLHIAHIALNQNVPPFDNVLVRQALNYAMDRQTSVLVSFEGLAVPARLMVSESAFGVNYAHAREYPYNLDRARQLLAEAGYPQGLNLGTMYTLASTYHEIIGQVFQSSCAQIGVTFDLLPMESTTLINMMIAGDFAFGNMGQGFQTDFAFGSRFYTTGSTVNYANYANPRVDELFALAEVETDPATRLRYYNEVVSIITNDAVNIPVQHREAFFAWVPGLNIVPRAEMGRPYYVHDWYWD